MAPHPKYFPDVGSPTNFEPAKDESSGLRIEVIVLYLSKNMDHKGSHDWGLLVGCSLLFPDPILEYCTERSFLLYVEESRS
jgi:hypothetical protein